MPYESERKTRREKIDPEISRAGWKIVDFDPRAPFTASERCAIREYPTQNGPADYALCVGGRNLGVIEAKKLSLGPQNILTRVERYSNGATTNPLAFRGYHVPFLYSTNGEVIWHHGIRHALSRSRRISHFHTPAALTERLQHDLEQACNRVRSTPNDHPLLRPYQFEANAAIERAIADRKRQMLVSMATGTGKAFTMVNQVYRLMKSRVTKRVLFLVTDVRLPPRLCVPLRRLRRNLDSSLTRSSQRFHRAGRVDRFSQAVLVKAFRGELVSTEAELVVQSKAARTVSCFSDRSRAQMCS